MSQPKASSATSADSSTAAKPKRRYRTAEQWRQIVDDFLRSSLTRSEFCKQHGIAISGLYNWQRKFEQEILPARDNEGAFVEIEPPALPGHRSHQVWDVELEFGQGRVLRVRMA